MVSSATWILSAKALFLSIGAASVAFFLKVSVPLMVECMISQLPLFWSSILSWLRPPYLYIVINGIIISIAASSKLHRSPQTSTDESPPVEAAVPDFRSPETVGALESEDVSGRSPVEAAVHDFSSPRVMGALELENVRVFQGSSFQEDDKTSDSAIESNNERNGEDEKEEEEFVISRSTWRSEFLVQEHLPQPPEKPLTSSRFIHRRQAKSNPEGGKALKVTKPKRHETLENTWKAITEGRPMPLTRHLRKSDTWDGGHGRQPEFSSPPLEQQKKVRKSETFRDRTNEQEQEQEQQSPLRAASPSQDELNRRVEAFIKKFNEEMRLQRQESLNHYQQMIGR